MGLGISQVSAKDAKPNLENPVSTFKVIIFDVNETLLDLAPRKQSVGKALGGHEEFLPL